MPALRHHRGSQQAKGVHMCSLGSGSATQHPWARSASTVPLHTRGSHLLTVWASLMPPDVRVRLPNSVRLRRPSVELLFTSKWRDEDAVILMTVDGPAPITHTLCAQCGPGVKGFTGPF